jgi:membrane protein YdbS with pleckstrin-like domain
VENKEEHAVLNIQRSRPLGITIIAVIMVIFGILGIIGALLLMSASAAVGIITLILSVLEIILAWGLWTLQRWAYWTTVVLEGLSVLNGLLALSQNSTGNGVLSIVIALVILVYLFADPNVRVAFRT